jgi:tRNA (cytidine32/uridine32-2'-O)-methyltransferase
LHIPVRIVLVDTSHPGNIGATARAMKTMGLTDLALVRPLLFPCYEATARAAGADDILASASVHSELGTAIEDCGWVVGASARLRTVVLPIVDPREAAP